MNRVMAVLEKRAEGSIVYLKAGWSQQPAGLRLKASVSKPGKFFIPKGDIA
jgi:hypothetical protein